jgi:DnaK suppressor protein
LLGGGLNPGNEALPDLGDQATAEIDKNFTLRLREREQKLLKKIDEAIDRISEGSFGICEECDGKISLKRLKARPVTTLCIECKTIQEQEEKIRR